MVKKEEYDRESVEFLLKNGTTIEKVEAATKVAIFAAERFFSKTRVLCDRGTRSRSFSSESMDEIDKKEIEELLGEDVVFKTRQYIPRKKNEEKKYTVVFSKKMDVVVPKVKLYKTVLVNDALVKENKKTKELEEELARIASEFFTRNKTWQNPRKKHKDKLVMNEENMDEIDRHMVQKLTKEKVGMGLEVDVTLLEFDQIEKPNVFFIKIKGGEYGNKRS